MKGRVIKVLAQIEVPCSQCGKPWRAMGLASVEDGRVCDGEAENEHIVCDECNRQNRSAVNKENRNARIRLKFLNPETVLKPLRTGA